MAREMTDSGIAWIGEIPKEWDTVKFKYLHNGLNTGESIDKDFWTTEESETVFYTAGLTPIRTSYKEFPIWKYTRSNDILLARNGTPYVYFPVEQACYSDHIIRAAMKDGINRRFVQYSLQQSIASVVVDTVSIATWSASLWNEQTIPWPSEIEQKRIVTYLDTECARIDAVMEQTRASIEEYKKLKQAVITQAVTKGIRPNRSMKDSGVDWLGKVPADWNVYRIANLYDERNESGEDSLPILSVSINTGISDHEVADEERARIFVRSEDKSKYKRVYPGDLAYNMMRAWQGAFGAVRVDGMVSPAYVVAKPKHNINLDSRYMEALLRTPSAIEEMHRYSHGITDFRLRLYWPEFKNIRVCIPSIDEQKEISDFIDKTASDVDTMISRKEQLLTEMESYKKSLIFEYITGKREIK